MTKSAHYSTWCGRQNPSKACQCHRCVAARFSAWLEKARKIEGIPPSLSKTVPVKRYTVEAHFRSHPGHLSSDPALAKLVDAYIRGQRAKLKPKLKVVR